MPFGLPLTAILCCVFLLPAPFVHATYQQDITTATQQFRPTPPHRYAGFDGPWIENYFFTFFAAQTISIPYIYLPVFWTDFLVTGKNVSLLNAFLLTLPSSHTFFTVVQLDRGIGSRHVAHPVSVPNTLRLVAFLSSGSSSCDPMLHMVPIPLLHRELPLSGSSMHTKTHVASFQGSFTHHIREDLFKTLNSTYTFLRSGSDWQEVIQKSMFSFTPRGFGESSFRLYQVLQLGTVPIVIWEKQRWLPFEELVEWDEFAIVLHAHAIRTGGVVRKVQAALSRYEDMQRAVVRVQHMFTFNFTCHYILQYLSTMNSRWGI
jgi:hypothetical protein